MKGKILFLTALCCGYLGVATAQKKEKLFNGKDLAGWTAIGEEKWFVENALLVCENGPSKQYGYLATVKKYKDFDLSVSFKQESNGNSGVFFHSSFEGTKVTGWQAEVAPPGKSTGGVYESYGRGWLIKPAPEKDKALKMGEWNTMRVRVKGKEVVTWLNGVEMIRLTDDKIGSVDGAIALQIHEGDDIRVLWKNLVVKKL